MGVRKLAKRIYREKIIKGEFTENKSYDEFFLALKQSIAEQDEIDRIKKDKQLLETGEVVISSNPIDIDMEQYMVGEIFESKYKDLESNIKLTSYKTKLEKKVNMSFSDLNKEKTKALEQELENRNILFADKYFNGEMNEIDDRIESHLAYVEKTNQENFTQHIKKISPNEYDEALYVKEFFESYKKDAHSALFFEKSKQYAHTIDKFRIDCGLILSRAPIFLK